MNTVTIPLTTITLKAGDRVRFVEPEVLIARSNNPDINYTNDNGVYSFDSEDDYLLYSSVDVDNDMLTLLYKWDTQEIKSIDKDGDITFVDIPYTWPKEVILEPVDENDNSLSEYIDSSKIDYVRIYKNEVGTGIFDYYCREPHAVLSKEDDGESVYFYTISKNDVNPSKHLEPEE